MKKIKLILAGVLILALSVITPFYLFPNNANSLLFQFIILGFALFHLLIRKSLLFKNYFVGKYNFLTAKSKFSKSYEISEDLLFEKIIEVINNSKLKLVDTDMQKHEILAISSMTLRSWGENLYFCFESNGDETIMKVCSTTLLQVHSWGKNKKNYNNLLENIENSFVI